MNTRRMIVIGTRESRLALVQAEWVRAKLMDSFPGIQFNLKAVKTKGDRAKTVPLEKLGGQGVFVKELEDALLAGRIDLAVHSLKDMLTTLPDGLVLAAVPERADPRDVLISRWGGMAHLPSGGVVGTGSLRRALQVTAKRDDLHIEGLRGNINTRLSKVDSGKYDGIIMAAAALHRLGLERRVTEYLPAEDFVPAVGQGALGIEVRQGDRAIEEVAARLNHEPTWQAVTAERTFLRSLGGGCRAPIAALGTADGGVLRIEGMVADPADGRIIRAAKTGKAGAAERVGRDLADEMMSRGAKEVIERAHW